MGYYFIFFDLLSHILTNFILILGNPRSQEVAREGEWWVGGGCKIVWVSKQVIGMAKLVGKWTQFDKINLVLNECISIKSY